MRKAILSVALIMIILPGFPVMADTIGFEGGVNDAMAVLEPPSFETTININVPANYSASNATMNILGMAAKGNSMAYPKGVEVRVNDSLIWAFNKTGYGSLGRQDEFSTGSNTVKAEIGVDGGTSKSFIKLPKNAIIQNAHLDMECVPTMNLHQLLNFSGLAAGDYLGYSVSDAGDLNNDGFDDVIIGANNAGANHSGAAYIFFGGHEINNTPDLVLTGQETNDDFGYSVSAAGDVNNDGYDDVIIGAWQYANHQGRAYLYFGGQSIDANPDIIFTGAAAGDGFGCSVSGAGDVNHDGYDDVIVGAWVNSSGGKNAGRAYIYFGGSSMDNDSDVIFTGNSNGQMGDELGCSVSNAGDMNNDGYDDVIVGAYGRQDYTNGPGAAFIYFGGQNMDNASDVELYGLQNNVYFGYSVSDAGDINNDSYADVIVGQQFGGRTYAYLGGKNIDNISDVIYSGFAGGNYGSSVSGARDVNNDGYDDVIIGAWSEKVAGSPIGRVYLYYGSSGLDHTVDLTFDGEADSDRFGLAVSGAGDVNNDSFDDIIIGAPRNDAGDTDAGRAYVYSPASNAGLLDPTVILGSEMICSMTGFFNGTTSSTNFTDALNLYLRSATVSGTDEYGNPYVNVQLNLSSKTGGNVTLSNLSIIYQYEATTSNFAVVLNNYLKIHQSDKDPNGNITVPVTVRSQTAGRVKLSSLILTRAPPPSLVQQIGRLELNEDTAVIPFLDLYPYFQDDSGPDTTLSFAVVSSTNSSVVRLWITAGRYLSADAMTGDANDNWTGMVEAKVACANRLGARTESNEFTILIKNVNDNPIITSTPLLSAEARVPYVYNVTAIDGDNDPLNFSLKQAPTNMTIDSKTGRIQWMPGARGDHNVTVAVSDGLSTSEQNYSINVPNKAPRITSEPPLKALTGIKYVYNVTAEDDNLDPLVFSISTNITGMTIDPVKGMIIWTPIYAKNYDVEITVSDGKAKDIQRIIITVVQGNTFPEFKSIPVTIAVVDVLYYYNTLAIDKDNDDLTFSLESGPSGMVVDPATGKLTWTPTAAGNFTVILKVSDSEGAETRQEFVIKVSDAVRPQLVLVSHKPGQTVKGTTTFSGSVTKGTREVTKVQLRIDGRDWTDAAGNYSWSCKLDTKTLKNGKHAFEFRAYDGKEYSDVVKAEFKVDNAAAAGKGFIPGPDATLVLIALGIGAVLSLRSKRFSKKSV